MKCLFFAFAAALCLAAPAARAQSADNDARARDLVSHMTLQEKLDELHGIKDKTYYRYVPPIPRLGIPALHVANGPAGVGPAGDNPQLPATALPSPILLASTWDLGLSRQYGAVIGKEARDLNEDLLEAPDINIARVPQNGRTFEAFGEDPCLVGHLAVSQIQGIQSQDEIANVKHFAANNQEEHRMTVNAVVDERTMREIYLPAFEASIREANCASIMGAYPRVNGAYCCENDVLLNQILKKEWGFKGFVTSDFGAVHSTVPSALNGLDLEMPTGKYFGPALQAAVESNQVPISVIDDKLVRRFRTMMEYGYFDHPNKRQPVPAQEDGKIAAQIAGEGMVLLKNKGQVLPLNPAKLHRVALVGPFASKAATGGGGSSHVVPLYTVDPPAGLRNRLGSEIKVDAVESTNLMADIDAAVAMAKSADVAIVMVGQLDAEGHDHKIVLPGNQDQLIEAVAAANPHTIVVLKTGSAVLMPWVDKVPAILEAWYPGEEDGNAVAAVLCGDVNPSGKLPITFPKHLEDLPANTPEQYPGVNGIARYSEGVFVGYRHFDARKIEPLFPFGYGLSYTTFGYKHLAVTPSRVSENATPKVSVDFDVTNTGKAAGKEIAQVYLGLPSTAAVPQPPKQLKAFQKLSLKPGQTGHVHLELDARAMSYWDVTRHDWAILPGNYPVLVGASSRDIRLKGKFKVTP